jgi:competence protein ComEA
LDIDAAGDGSLNGAARFERAVHRREQEALMSRSTLVALITLLATAAVLPPPAVADTAPATRTAASRRAAKVNINTATVQELMTLAGVGRGLAEKIVQHRDAHGLFKKPEDLRQVDGVGGALWNKNRARIVVK